MCARMGEEVGIKIIPIGNRMKRNILPIENEREPNIRER